MGTSVLNGQKFFILFGKKYYFIEKLKFFYYNNLFGNVFQTSGVIGFIMTLYVRNSDAKKVFQLLEKVFSLKTRFSQFPSYFHVFAYLVYSN